MMIAVGVVLWNAGELSLTSSSKGLFPLSEGGSAGEGDMKISTVLIVAIWLFVVGGNILSSFTRSADVFKNAPSLPWPIVFLPLVVIFGAFRMQDLPGEHTIGKVLDQRFGLGSYRRFMQALQPELMFSAMCFGIVASSMVRFAQLGAPNLPLPILGFFASGSVAFLVAHFIRKRREAK